jgi:uroporphyrinogen decarboxylase
MDSRERVMATVNHMEPDRVPVDFWWSGRTRDRLLDHLRLKDEDELQDYLGSDIRCIYPAYCGPTLKHFADGSYEDWWGIVRRPYACGSGEFDEIIRSPLAHAATWRDIEGIRWPDPDWFDYEGLASQAARYEGRAVMVGRMGIETQSIFVQTWFLRGASRALLDLSQNPDLMKAMVQHIMGFRIEHVRRILKALDGRADLLQIADDYGTQKGLMISPDAFRTFFAPHLLTLSNIAHDAGAKVFFHCCGSCRMIIPDLIEMGVDVLNPIDGRSAGMEPSALKADFGRDLAFHGGILMGPYDRPEEIASEVGNRIRVLAPGGGYVLAPTTSIEEDTPIENILAFCEAAKTLGEYRHEIS